MTPGPRSQTSPSAQGTGGSRMSTGGSPPPFLSGTQGECNGRALARPTTRQGTVRRRRPVLAEHARAHEPASSLARARPIVGAASGVLRQAQAGSDIPPGPAELVRRACQPSGDVIEFIDRSPYEFQGRERLVSRSSLAIHIANGSRISPAKLSLDEPPEIHRHRDATNDRRLAERTPHAGVDRDPRRRVRAGHQSNGATRCTVVQLCGRAVCSASQRQDAGCCAPRPGVDGRGMRGSGSDVPAP